MASRKTQQKLAKGVQAAAEPEPLVDEASAQAFADMMKRAQEAREQQEREAKERYERQVAAHDRFVGAIEKLADALEHVAVRIAFDHGVKQAEARPTRAERADPKPDPRQTSLPEPKAAAKPEPRPEPHPSSGRRDVEPPTGEDVRALVRSAVKAGHGHEAVELLAKYGAESVSDLKPADLPAVFTALQKLAG